MDFSLLSLLRFLWIAAALLFLAAALPSSPLRDFVSQAFKRGKSPPSTPTRFTLPHKFFSHFYIVGVVWVTILLGSTWTLACKNSETWKSAFLLLLMELQVVRRLYESFFVFNHYSSARMHAFTYLFGLLYYLFEPISLCSYFASDVLIHVRNLIKFGMVDIKLPTWECFMPLAELGFCQWVGAAIFFWGWIHQLRCHKILGSLRKRRGNDYAIPHGDWFEVSSSAHYLAEIVIYIGLLVASGGDDATLWLILVFVVANLSFNAGETHQWYLQKFEDYPRSRSAIIPLIY